RKVYPERENNRPSLVPGHRCDAAIPAARKANVTADVTTVQVAGGGTAGTRVTAALYPAGRERAGWGQSGAAGGAGAGYRARALARRRDSRHGAGPPDRTPDAPDQHPR